MIMHSRVISVTTVIVLNLIAGVFFYTQKGMILFIPFACVASMAFILWLLVKNQWQQNRIIVPYLVTILGLILLNMLRLLGGFASTGSTLFNAVFLLGGYYLLNRTDIGAYMACFVFLWSIFQGLLQFYMAITLHVNYINYYYSGIGAGIMVILLGLFGGYRLMCRQKPKVPTSECYQPRNRINLWTLFILNLAIIYSIIILSAQPYPTPDLVLFWLSLIVGLLLWRRTIALSPLNPVRVGPLYLLMLALYMLYLQESDIFQIEEHIALLFKTNLPATELIFIKTMIMLYGGISLWRREVVGNLIALVVCINLVLTQSMVFFVFPILEAISRGQGYHYFPGMWSSLLPLIPAISIITTIIQDHTKHREHQV